MMFWADNYTQNEFIAFCDSDTLFLTYVDKSDIFSSNDKPIVQGLVTTDLQLPLYSTVTLVCMYPCR